MKKLKNILLISLIIILTIILINILYSKLIKKEKIISIFGNTIFIVETGSMEPTIKAGELLIVSKKNNYSVNDIVTVIDNEGYIYTHRIVSKNGEIFITKGDGNSIFDEPIHKELILGEVIYHSKILGYFVIHILKPLIVIYVFIIIVTYIIGFYKKEEESEKELNN